MFVSSRLRRATVRACLPIALAAALTACGGGGSGGATEPSGPSAADLLAAARLVTQYDVAMGRSIGPLGRFATSVLVFASQPQSIPIAGACDNAGGTYVMIVFGSHGPQGGLVQGTNVDLTGHNCLLSSIGPVTFDGHLVLTPTASAGTALPTQGSVSTGAYVMASGLALSEAGSTANYLSATGTLSATIDSAAGTSDIGMTGASVLVSSDAPSATSTSPTTVTLAASAATIRAIESPTTFSYSLDSLGANIAVGVPPVAQLAFVMKTTTPLSGTIGGGSLNATAGSFEGDQFAGSSSNVSIQLNATGGLVNGSIATTWASLLGL